MSQPSPVTLRRAVPADAPAIWGFVMGLAEHQGHMDEVEATEAQIEAALFGDTPLAFCDLAERDGELIGCAIWFYTFSTWTGRRGIYLEDLFVSPTARGSGAGKILLAHLARVCVEEGLARIEWIVLNDNHGGIKFYAREGAIGQSDQTTWRLDGEAMETLARFRG